MNQKEANAVADVIIRGYNTWKDTKPSKTATSVQRKGKGLNFNVTRDLRQGPHGVMHRLNVAFIEGIVYATFTKAEGGDREIHLACGTHRMQTWNHVITIKRNCKATSDKDLRDLLQAGFKTIPGMIA